MARSLGVAAAALVVLLLLLCDGASAIERARHQVDDVAISDISLLLPFGAKTKVSYEIEAYNGCFKWFVSSSCATASALQPDLLLQALCMAVVAS